MERPSYIRIAARNGVIIPSPTEAAYREAAPLRELPTTQRRGHDAIADTVTVYLADLEGQASAGHRDAISPPARLSPVLARALDADERRRTNLEEEILRCEREIRHASSPRAAVPWVDKARRLRRELSRVLSTAIGAS